MTIYTGKDYQDVSRKAANIMSAQIIMKPDAHRWACMHSWWSGTKKEIWIFQK